MHCLHVNAHVSLHLDVADILRTLGHTFDQVCLSEHMWVIGGKPGLKRPQPEGGKRRDSFCARMEGMKKKLTSAKSPDRTI